MTTATKTPTAHEALDRLSQQAQRIRRSVALAVEARNTDTARIVELNAAAQAVRVAAARLGDDPTPALAALDAERAQIDARTDERAKSANAARRALVELQDERAATIEEYRPELLALAAEAVDDGAVALIACRRSAAEVAAARERIRSAWSVALSGIAPDDPLRAETLRAPWAAEARRGLSSPFKALADAVEQLGKAGE